MMGVRFKKDLTEIDLIFKERLLLYFKLLLVKVQQRNVFREYSSFIHYIYQGFKKL